MPTEEVSAMELLKQREKEAYEELGKMKLDDPNRRKLLDEAKTYSDIRVAYEETEQTRLNNNAKNDLDEQRIVVEMQKVKNEKSRIKSECFKAGMYVVAGFVSGFSSYMLDSWFQDYKPLKRFQDRVHDLLTKK